MSKKAFDMNQMKSQKQLEEKASKIKDEFNTLFDKLTVTIWEKLLLLNPLLKASECLMESKLNRKLNTSRPSRIHKQLSITATQIRKRVHMDEIEESMQSSNELSKTISMVSAKASLHGIAEEEQLEVKEHGITPKPKRHCLEIKNEKNQSAKKRKIKNHDVVTTTLLSEDPSKPTQNYSNHTCSDVEMSDETASISKASLTSDIRAKSAQPTVLTKQPFKLVLNQTFTPQPHTPKPLSEQLKNSIQSDVVMMKVSRTSEAETTLKKPNKEEPLMESPKTKNKAIPRVSVGPLNLTFTPKPASSLQTKDKLETTYNVSRSPSNRVTSLMSEESEDEMASTTVAKGATTTVPIHAITPANNITNLSRLGGVLGGAVLGPLVRTPWSSGAQSWLSRNGWFKSNSKSQLQVPHTSINTMSTLSRLTEDSAVKGSGSTNRLLSNSTDCFMTSKQRLPLQLNNNSKPHSIRETSLSTVRPGHQLKRMSQLKPLKSGARISAATIAAAAKRNVKRDDLIARMAAKEEHCRVVQAEKERERVVRAEKERERIASVRAKAQRIEEERQRRAQNVVIAVKKKTDEFAQLQQQAANKTKFNLSTQKEKRPPLISNSAILKSATNNQVKLPVDVFCNLTNTTMSSITTTNSASLNFDCQVPQTQPKLTPQPAVENSFLSYDLTGVLSEYDSDSENESNRKQKPIPAWAKPGNKELMSWVYDMYAERTRWQDVFLPASEIHFTDAELFHGYKYRSRKRGSSAVWIDHHQLPTS